jgi:hypothetical protein
MPGMRGDNRTTHPMEADLKKLILALVLLALPVAGSISAVQPAFAAAKTPALGDLSAMRAIVSDTLALVKAGSTTAAVKKITEFETAWDANASRLEALDAKAWGRIDEAADVALSTVRYSSTTAEEKTNDLNGLIAALDNPR